MFRVTELDWVRPDQRRELRRQGWLAVCRDRSFLRLLSPLLAAPVVMLGALVLALASDRVSPGGLHLGLVAVVLIVYGLIVHWRAVILVRRWVRHEMTARMIRSPHCLSCGYDLHGSTSDACPECGQLIVPLIKRNQ